VKYTPICIRLQCLTMYRDSEQRDFARGLRNQPTGAEKELWRFLRAGQLDGHKFRRQVALGAYIVDFVCLAQRLVVELDGPQHLEDAAAEYDARRTDWLLERGYRVIRFRNHEVDEDVRLVVDKIRQALEETSPTPLHPPLPSPPLQGEGAGGSGVEVASSSLLKLPPR
jgi:very-short-patch-repair endonuclease